MKRNFIASALLAAAFSAGAAGISSPSGNLVLNVSVNDSGSPTYSLSYKGKTLVADSRLGLVADEMGFADNFTISATDTMTVDRSWEPVWGEYSTVRDHFRELAVTFTGGEPSREMTVRFRVFDDGLGFRYELPRQDNANYLTLRDEATEFNFTADHKLFCIPGTMTLMNICGLKHRFRDCPARSRHIRATRRASARAATPSRRPCC